MKIELKNITVSTRQSEETMCFAAAVCVDGVKRGEVSNDGRVSSVLMTVGDGLMLARKK